MITAPKITGSRSPALDDADHLIQGIFDPPQSFSLAAIARNKLIVIALGVVFTILGLGYGISRHRTYTTSATLQVGQVNPNSPGFYGYVQSAASLATAFSRAVYAEPVLKTVDGKLGLTPAQAVGRLSAEPIPVSPAFRVIATGPSQGAAVALANIAAGAVVSYVSQANSTNPESASLLHQYQQAALALRHAVANSAELGRKKGASIEVLANAEAAKNAAAVKLRAIGVAYTNTVTSQAPSSGLVSLVAGATTASNDRNSKVELFGLVGLLIGVVLGCLAAVGRERRRIAGRGATGKVEAQTSEAR